MNFTTNKPLSEWGKVLHDEDLAAAILDRVLERGRSIHLDGLSVNTSFELGRSLAGKVGTGQNFREQRVNKFPEPTPVVSGFALLHLSSCMFISSDNADRFLKLASTRGCTVSTMVLSATRGLVLFRVIREGIGLTQRLSATGTVRLQAIRMLTLEPERLKNQLATTRKRSPEMEGSSRETLKRLAISVCQRRSFLPSSIELA